MRLVALLAIASAAHAASIPAPTGGSAPTIVLSAEHGAAGDVFTVSGTTTDATSPGVRLQWLLTHATEPTIEVPLDGARHYAASMTVPLEATPGTARLCAGLVDLPLAELACADFVVDAAPPGTVVGTLPGGTNAASASRRAAASAITSPFGGTVVGLVDRTGKMVAQATPAANGAFSLPAVPAGRYTVVQDGVAPKLTAPISITVRPGLTTQATVAALTKPVACPTTDTAVLLNSVRLRPSAEATNATWGTYIHGVPLEVELYSWSFAQTRVEGRAALPVPPALEPVSAMRYDVYGPNGELAHTLVGAAPGYEAAFDVGTLPVGISRVVAHPIVGGVACTPAGGAFQRTIRVIGNPVGELARDDSTITWVPNGDASHYRFRLTLPNIPLLPFDFPRDPLPVPLPIPLDQNHFDAGVTLQGVIRLDGSVTFSPMPRTFFDFTVLGQGILNESAEAPIPPELRINIADPRTFGVAFAVPSILPIEQEFTIYDGTVFDLFGLVQFRASMSLGFDGDVGVDGVVQPLLPYVRLRVTPRLAARGSASLGVGVLNVVSGGGRMKSRFGLAVPLVASVDPFAPTPVDVDAEGACLFLQASAEFFVRITAGPITLHELTSPSYPVILPSGPPLYFPSPFCTIDDGALRASLAASTDDAEEPPPFGTVDPAPAVAASPSGDVMRVRVMDGTAGTGDVTPVLVSELRDPISGAWGTPSPITDGTHWVGDPALTWWGTDEDATAVVVWSERPTTLAQDLDFGTDVATMMNRHEVFLATWHAGSWSAPQRLTDDLVADGSASIAGDAEGFTLAWVRDTDGDLHTHLDLRIAVIDAPAGVPVPLYLLGVDDDAMNTQPSVARSDGFRTIAWTADDDADLGTDADRRIVLARWDDGWNLVELPDLPPAADSPSVTLAGSVERLAFLVRGLDDDGEPVGAVSVGARVYVATDSGLDNWTVAPVLESPATHVVARGESPTLVTGRDGETLLVYRRFGSSEPVDTWGQVVMATLGDDARTSEPMALTRGDRQRWFPSVAVDPASGEAIVVALDLPGEAPAPADYAVVTRVVAAGGDPALERLTRDRTFAAPGSSVPVRVTLRNAGRDAIALADVGVAFFDGSPESGTLVTIVPATTGAVGSLTELAPNQTVVLGADVVARPGVQPISAKVLTTGDDADPSNDVVTAELRALSPPLHVQVAPSDERGGALDVTWVPPAEVETDDATSPVVGYRIERSDVAGGSRELAGEATTSRFRDALLQTDQTYCYAVVAFDDTGVLSAPSAESCSTVPASAPAIGQRLTGATLRLTADAAKPSGRALSVVSKDPTLAIGAGNGSAADPVLHGATLDVGSGSGDTFAGRYELPAHNWSYLGAPGRNLGYRYREKNRLSPAGPVTSIVVKTGKNVRIAARGAALALTLAAVPDPVDIVLALGEQELCMRFGGDVEHLMGKRFTARRAPAPPHCPMLPDVVAR